MKSGRAVWIIRNSLGTVPLFDWDGDTLAFESTQSTEGQQEQAWRGDRVHYLQRPDPKERRVERATAPPMRCR